MKTLQEKIEEVRRDNEGKFREKNWIEKLRGWIFRKIINTKGGYLIVGMVIASAFTYITLEAPDYYNYVRIGYAYAEEVRGRQGDGVVLFDRTVPQGNEEVGIKVPDTISQSTSLSIDSLIKKYFGEDWKIALAIAKAESNLNPEAINKNTNGTIDAGIFQINDCHGMSVSERLDAEKNIAKAHELYQKSGWTPWVAFTSNSFKKFL